MLAIFSNSTYPPEYRFRDNLAPAGVADKIYNRSAVINCTKLSSIDRANLCRERIGFLTQLLQEYRTRLHGLREVIEVIEGEIAREQSWASRLEILISKNHPDKKNTSASNYQGLVSEPITQIVDIGQTSKGVFYLRYERLDRRHGCSFVSKRKLLVALGEIQSQREGTPLVAKRLWLEAGESLLLEFENCEEKSVLAIKQAVRDLTLWITGERKAGQPVNEDTTSDEEENIATSDLASMQQARVRSQVWSALMDEGLTVFVAEEFGEVFFRVHRLQSFLGVISVDGEGTISILSSVEGAESKIITSPVRAVESLKLAFSPVPPKTSKPTITLEDWEALKQIVKGGTERQILTTDETLSIVLDPKYLRPCEPGQAPSPRMILCEHYLEIRRRLFDAVAQKQASIPYPKEHRDVWEYCNLEFDEQQKAEINRFRIVYPREASRLEQLFEVVRKYEGLKLANIVVQPFSVCVTDTNLEPLARLSISAFSHSWQIQQVVKGYFSNACHVDSLESAIANLFQARYQVQYIKQLVLQ